MPRPVARGESYARWAGAGQIDTHTRAQARSLPWLPQQHSRARPFSPARTTPGLHCAANACRSDPSNGGRTRPSPACPVSSAHQAAQPSSIGSLSSSYCLQAAPPKKLVPVDARCPGVMLPPSLSAPRARRPHPSPSRESRGPSEGFPATSFRGGKDRIRGGCADYGRGTVVLFSDRGRIDDHVGVVIMCPCPRCAN